MLSIYWVCFVGGGIFVFLAVIGGIDGADFDVGADIGLFEPELEFDSPGIDADAEVYDEKDPRQEATDVPRSRSRPFNLLLIFKTIKFWTFGLCFFGLTGLLFSWFVPNLSPPMILAIAVVMGLLIGGGMASVLQLLRYQNVNSLVKPGELVGQIGTVEIPFDQNSRGKVRLHYSGNIREMVARTSDTRSLESGDTIVVVGIEENQLWVVAEESLKES